MTSAAIQLTELHYDAVLVGTGLTNTILAAALAKQGKRVLHIDGQERYGSLHASLTLNDFLALSSQPHSQSQSAMDEWPVVAGDSDCQYQYQPVTYRSSITNINILQSPSQSLLSQSRSFNLDLTPAFIVSRSLLVELMIASSVSSYIDFRAIDSQYICASIDTGLQSLPINRSQVFASNLIDLIEKRLLMRFLQSVVPNHRVSASQQEKSSAEIAEYTDRPFVEYLQSKQLPPKLMDFVLYAIANIEHTQSPSLPQPHSSVVNTRDGVARTRLFLESIGRYSSGAYLTPIYGVGELPQAFSRLCAVNAGIYILRFQPRAIVTHSHSTLTDNHSSGVYKGIITEGNQLVTSDYLIVESEYVSSYCRSDDSDSVSCSVCILDGEVRDSSGAVIDGESVLVFPANSAGNCQPIRVLQLTQSVNAAPTGCVVLYLTTPRVAGAEADLQPIVAFLTSRERANDTATVSVNEAASDNKPRLLFSAFYERSILKHNPTQPLPKGVAITASPSPLLPVDASVREAEVIFTRLCPDVSLVDALKDENRVSTVDAEQLNELESILGQSAHEKSAGFRRSVTGSDEEAKLPTPLPIPSPAPESDARSEVKEPPIESQPSISQ